MRSSGRRQFFRSGARPSHDEIIRYVDAYRDQFGVELICRVLANTVGVFMTSCGYRAAKTRPLSHCAIRDQVLNEEMERLHAENYGVYGVRKMHSGCLSRLVNPGEMASWNPLAGKSVTNVSA